MYKAYIAKITHIRPHPDADRIQLGSTCGSQVVVGLDTQEGELGIYFPEDGQLSEEFAQANNLVRYRDEQTGEMKGGFFEKNRRVRTQKFRGAKSEGFWCPLSYLNYLKIDVDNISEEGYTFTELCGHKICNKYHTPATLRVLKNKNNIKSIKRGETLYFPKHVKDTIQLRHMLDNIPSPSLIWVTEKLHGCLFFDTPIAMGNGDKKLIGEIEVGDKILGQDKEGKIVENSVLNIFNNGKSPNGWLKIKVRKFKAKGNYFSQLICTPNHKVWDSNLSSYREISEYKVGDRLSGIRHDFIITPIQEQILMGKLLGDGCLRIFNNSARLEYGHKKEHEEYVKWTMRGLGNLANDHLGKRISGFGTEMITGHTKSSSSLYEMFSHWYKNNIKEVPSDAVSKIGPIALAFWYMDDGSLGHSEKQEDRANFATCGFSKKSIDNLCEIFRKFSIEPTPYISNNGGKEHWRIRLNSMEAEKFFILITPYIPQVMQYKLPERFRGYSPFLPKDKEVFGPILVEREILSIEKINGDYDRYDIETETHNFFANGILVHNSSQRIGHVLDDVYLPWWKKNLNKIYPLFPEYSYVTLVGTKNVILQKTTGEGFYGTHDFRYKVIDGLVLKKGEVLYGEVVGYVHGNTPIMPSQVIKKSEVQDLIPLYGDTMRFTYGCKEGEAKFFIYRIIHMGEDGHYVELSWPQVKKRCSELGIPHVPDVLPMPILFTGDSEALVNLSEQLNQGSSLLDSSHMREGVVLRIEHNGNVMFVKDKSFAFKILEGIVKSQDDYVDLEEVEEEENE